MQSEKTQLMIYGANGYSAQLIIDELFLKNIKPVLAGRNEGEIKRLADKYNCDFRVFDLIDNAKIDKALNDVHTLLNCAGPFKYTAKELLEACLRTKTNYLDITGEIPVLHLAFSMDQKAKESKIVILPSVGFDIIPTDCLAKRLSELIPDATHLKLGLMNKGGKTSRGTLLTTLDSLGGTGRIRKDGQLIESEIGEFVVNVKMKDFSFSGVSIPWGDVYSSYYSTGIPNVEVYLAMPRFIIHIKPLLVFILKIARMSFVRTLLADYIKKKITGPTKLERDSTETYIWGRVENAKGEMIEEVYRFMEGYNLTANGAAECVQRVLKNTLKPGTYTPSLAFSSGFMDQFVVKTIHKES